MNAKTTLTRKFGAVDEDGNPTQIEVSVSRGEYDGIVFTTTCPTTAQVTCFELSGEEFHKLISGGADLLNILWADDEQ